jgi:broad specificity phosphatase PhoE
MRRTSHATFAFGALLGVSMVAAAPAVCAEPLVILVRHAEKSSEPGGDPSLSDQGKQRAEALANALRDARVTAIYTTQLKRTRETAAPIAKLTGVTPQAIQAGGGVSHVEAVAAAVRRHADGVVLVVGHSNTVPAVIAALGGPRVPEICESAFGNLFTLVPGKEGAAVVASRYGAPDQESAAGCK